MGNTSCNPHFIYGLTKPFRHAYYCLKNYNSAVEAFSDGLKLEPNNAHLKAGLENAKARAAPSSSTSVAEQSTPPTGGDAASGGIPDLSSLAGMFGGGGGGGGQGGLPNFSEFMNNPRFMEMAQNLMANGGMERLMQNPTLSNMVSPLTLCCCCSHNLYPVYEGS